MNGSKNFKITPPHHFWLLLIIFFIIPLIFTIIFLIILPTLNFYYHFSHHVTNSHLIPIISLIMSPTHFLIIPPTFVFFLLFSFITSPTHFSIIRKIQKFLHHSFLFQDCPLPYSLLHWAFHNPNPFQHFFLSLWAYYIILKRPFGLLKSTSSMGFFKPFSFIAF